LQCFICMLKCTRNIPVIPGFIFPCNVSENRLSFGNHYSFNVYLKPGLYSKKTKF
jgi:hypothetical protein